MRERRVRAAAAWMVLLGSCRFPAHRFFIQCEPAVTGGKGAHWWRARGWSEEAAAVTARDFDSMTMWLRHPKCLGGVFTESGVFPEFQEAKRVKDAEVAQVRAATARKKEAIKAEWDANIQRAVAEKRQRETARRAHDAAAAGDAPEGRLTAAALAGHLWQSVVDAAKPAKMRGASLWQWMKIS